MTRVTTANKTIKGFYHQVIYATYQALLLGDNDWLACEKRNSDFFIRVPEKGNYSVEVKYYGNNLGWGDQPVKNTIRNFIDIEKDTEEIFYYRLLTNVSSKNSTPINWWNEIREGRTENYDKLCKEIKILYISQTNDEISAAIVRENFDDYDATMSLEIDFESFIKRVEFIFEYDITTVGIQEKIRELCNQQLGQQNLAQEDVDSIMYCLLDKIWRSVISSDESGDKKITKNDIIEIINNREMLIADILKREYIRDFIFAEEYFGYMAEILQSTTIFFGNNDLKNAFIDKFDRVATLLLDNYEKEDILLFIKNINSYCLFKSRYKPSMRDLEDIVMFLSYLCLAVEDDINNIELRDENNLKNLIINNCNIGFYSPQYYRIPDADFVKFIADRFIQNPPIDIEDFEADDIIILKDFNAGYFCGGNCDQYADSIDKSKEFLSSIIRDYTSAGELNFDKKQEMLDTDTLTNFICKYHCGNCCFIDGRQGIDVNRQRIGRILKRD